MPHPVQCLKIVKDPPGESGFPPASLPKWENSLRTGRSMKMAISGKQMFGSPFPGPLAGWMAAITLQRELLLTADTTLQDPGRPGCQILPLYKLPKVVTAVAQF